MAIWIGIQLTTRGEWAAVDSQDNWLQWNSTQDFQLLYKVEKDLYFSLKGLHIIGSKNTQWLHQSWSASPQKCNYTLRLWCPLRYDVGTAGSLLWWSAWDVLYTFLVLIEIVYIEHCINQNEKQQICLILEVTHNGQRHHCKLHSETPTLYHS